MREIYRMQRHTLQRRRPDLQALITGLQRLRDANAQATQPSATTWHRCPCEGPCGCEWAAMVANVEKACIELPQFLRPTAEPIECHDCAGIKPKFPYPLCESCQAVGPSRTCLCAACAKGTKYELCRDCVDDRVYNHGDQMLPAQRMLTPSEFDNDAGRTGAKRNYRGTMLRRKHDNRATSMQANSAGDLVSNVTPTSANLEGGRSRASLPTLEPNSRRSNAVAARKASARSATTASIKQSRDTGEDDVLECWDGPTSKASRGNVTRNQRIYNENRRSVEVSHGVPFPDGQLQHGRLANARSRFRRLRIRVRLSDYWTSGSSLRLQPRAKEILRFVQWLNHLGAEVNLDLGVENGIVHRQLALACGVIAAYLWCHLYGREDWYDHVLAKDAVHTTRCDESAKWLGFHLHPVRQRSDDGGMCLLSGWDVIKLVRFYANYHQIMGEQTSWNSGDDWTRNNANIVDASPATPQVGSYDEIVASITESLCQAASAMSTGGNIDQRVRGAIMNNQDSTQRGQHWVLVMYDITKATTVSANASDTGNATG